MILKQVGVNNIEQANADTYNRNCIDIKTDAAKTLPWIVKRVFIGSCEIVANGWEQGGPERKYNKKLAQMSG